MVYNDYGWHDPQGRFFVLKEDIEKEGTLDDYLAKVERGDIRPEPLVLRVNAGDCIEVRLTNFLPERIEASAFQLETITDIVGYHIHLVKFDTIVSDGAANGWNNIAGARRYETPIERFFANEELNTVFFHDHLYANVHQQHGLFGTLIVEPTGAEFLDSERWQPLKSGTKAVIRTADGQMHREFVLALHDFALLFDGEGCPLNPPEHPGSDDDPGEPMVIRLLDGAHEEQHIFNITGLPWRKEITDPVSPLVQVQTIGISEAFNLRIDEPYAAGDYSTIPAVSTICGRGCGASSGPTARRKRA